MRYNFTGDLRKKLIWHAKQLRGCEITNDQLFLFQVQIAVCSWVNYCTKTLFRITLRSVVANWKVLWRFSRQDFNRLQFCERWAVFIVFVQHQLPNYWRSEYISLCRWINHSANACLSFLPLLLFQIEIVVPRIGDLFLNCCWGKYH